MIVGPNGHPVNATVEVVGVPVPVPASRDQVQAAILLQGVACSECRALLALPPALDVSETRCPKCGSAGSLGAVEYAGTPVSTDALLWALVYEVGELRERLKALEALVPSEAEA